MKRLSVISVLLMILLVFCACDQTGSNSDSSSTTTWYDKTDGTGCYYRQGYLYTGLDSLVYDGTTYLYCDLFSLHFTEVDLSILTSVGIVKRIVDGEPKNDFENARDLNVGDSLYTYAGCPSLLFAQTDSGFRVYTSENQLIHTVDAVSVQGKTYKWAGLLSDNQMGLTATTSGFFGTDATGSLLLPDGSTFYLTADGQLLYAKCGTGYIVYHVE